MHPKKQPTQAEINQQALDKVIKVVNDAFETANETKLKTKSAGAKAVEVMTFKEGSEIVVSKKDLADIKKQREAADKAIAELKQTMDRAFESAGLDKKTSKQQTTVARRSYGKNK